MSVDLEGLAGRAVQAALDAGATDAEAYAGEDQSREVRVYDGQVESLSDAGGRGVGVRAFAGERAGYAYTTDLSDEGLAAVGRSAREAASVADPDEYAGLPDECGATPVEGLASPELARWTTEQKVELALAAERAARAREGVTQVEQAVYSDVEGAVALANSLGFSGAYTATQAWSYVSAFAGDGADLMTGLGVALGRDPSQIDPEAVGGEAADRALALVGARQPESRRCPVVLDALVAASFVAIVGGMLSAESVQRGRSLFEGREGDEVADPQLELVDDATDPEGPASAPFDGEGSPTRRTPLIEGGRLLTFIFDVRSARRAGRSTTGGRVPLLLPLAPVGGRLEPDRQSRRRGPRRASAPGGRRPLRHRRGRAPLRGQPGVGHVLGRSLRTADRERPAGGAGQGDHHRQRPRLDAPRDQPGGVGGTVDARGRKRQGTPASGGRDVRFRFLSGLRANSRPRTLLRSAAIQCPR